MKRTFATGALAGSLVAGTITLTPGAEARGGGLVVVTQTVVQSNGYYLVHGQVQPRVSPNGYMPTLTYLASQQYLQVGRTVKTKRSLWQRITGRGKRIAWTRLGGAYAGDYERRHNPTPRGVQTRFVIPCRYGTAIVRPVSRVRAIDNKGNNVLGSVIGRTYVLPCE